MGNNPNFWTSNAVPSLTDGFYSSGFVFLFHTLFKQFLEELLDKIRG